MGNSVKNKNKAADAETGCVRDYGNEPYFVKKADKSKAFLEEHGFPKDLIDEKHFRM